MTPNYDTTAEWRRETLGPRYLLNCRECDWHRYEIGHFNASLERGWHEQSHHNDWDSRACPPGSVACAELPDGREETDDTDEEAEPESGYSRLFWHAAALYAGVALFAVMGAIAYTLEMLGRIHPLLPFAPVALVIAYLIGWVQLIHFFADEGGRR